MESEEEEEEEEETEEQSEDAAASAKDADYKPAKVGFVWMSKNPVLCCLREGSACHGFHANNSIAHGVLITFHAPCASSTRAHSQLRICAGVPQAGSKRRAKAPPAPRARRGKAAAAPGTQATSAPEDAPVLVATQQSQALAGSKEHPQQLAGPSSQPLQPTQVLSQRDGVAQQQLPAANQAPKQPVQVPAKQAPAPQQQEELEDVDMVPQTQGEEDGEDEGMNENNEKAAAGTGATRGAAGAGPGPSQDVAGVVGPGAGQPAAAAAQPFKLRVTDNPLAALNTRYGANLTSAAFSSPDVKACVVTQCAESSLHPLDGPSALALCWPCCTLYPASSQNRTCVLKTVDQLVGHDMPTCVCGRLCDVGCWRRQACTGRVSPCLQRRCSSKCPASKSAPA